MAINPLAAVGSLATAVESMRGGHVGYMEHVPATIGTGELTRRFSSSTSLTSMRAKSVPEDLASILEVRCSTTRLVGVFWSVLGRWFRWSALGLGCCLCGLCWAADHVGHGYLGSRVKVDIDVHIPKTKVICTVSPPRR